MNSQIPMEPFVHALLHTLWLGAGVALLLAFTLHQIPARLTNFRYGLSALALFIVMAGGIGTWAARDVGFRRTSQATDLVSSGEEPKASVTPSGDVHAPMIYQTVEIAPPPASPANWIVALAVGWLCGATLFLCRTAFSVLGASRLRSNSLEILPLPAVLQETLAALNMAKRRVRLFASERVQSPAVIGLFVPAILPPASLLASAPREVLRAVLAHELAHIRRWDYLVNLGQMFIESLLFFNPFVWWISRQIRREREACCDQIAAELCGSQSAYLEALLVCVASDNHDPLPAAALAANGGERTLLDRARRLLEPGYRPAMRIRGVTFAGVITVTGLILIALLAGARVAVEALTPQQRIEKITEIKKEYAPEAEKEEPQHTITLSGTVLTEDGMPIGKEYQLLVLSVYRNSSANHGARVERDGRFSADVPSGIISIGAWASGYEPSFRSPFIANQDLRDLHIVLPKGFDGRIHLTDEEGKPIKGARITGRYTPSPSVGRLEATTDDQGLALFPAVGNTPTELSVTTKGFETSQRSNLRFSADDPVQWVLKRTRPFKGRIISSRTGEPIANAEIKLAGVNGPQDDMCWPGHAKSLATTNAQGEFTIDTLRDDSTYTFYISAKGHGKILSPSAALGEDPVEWKLGEPLSIRGKVVFPPSSTPPKEVAIECKQTFQLRPNSTYSSADAPPVKAPVKDGIASFEFTDLYAVSTEISVDGRRKHFPEFQETLEDVVIEFTPRASAETARGAERLVEITFDLPSESPKPTGSLRVGYYEYGTSPGKYRLFRLEEVPLKNGKGLFKLPVPNEVEIEPAGLIGYSFPGGKRFVIPESDGTHSIVLPATPAGAIYGEIAEADGSPAHGLLISVNTHPDAKGNRPPSLSVKRQASGTSDIQAGFVATPLPLNATYSVVISRSQTYVVTPPISIDEKTPIQKTKIVIPKGTTVRVRTTDPSGKAVRGLEWYLNFKTSWGYSFGSGNLWTEGDGWLVIPNVNFDVPGEYRVQLNSRAKYLPIEQAIDPKKPEFEIQLKQGKTLSGIVIEAKTGWPVSGLDVYARYADTALFHASARSPTPGFFRFEAEAPTDEHGRFQFSNLPDAPMIMGFGSANHPEGARDITASPGQTEPILLKAKLLPGGEARAVKPPEPASPFIP